MVTQETEREEMRKMMQDFEKRSNLPKVVYTSYDKSDPQLQELAKKDLDKGDWLVDVSNMSEE